MSMINVESSSEEPQQFQIPDGVQRHNDNYQNNPHHYDFGVVSMKRTKIGGEGTEADVDGAIIHFSK